MTPSEGLTILLPFLRADHTCCLTAAFFDFAKGEFFEANRGKNHTLYLYLSELLICVKGITEVVFYFVFSFTVKEGSKKGLKKERRPIANRQLLYQSSLLPHFLPYGATVTHYINKIKTVLIIGFYLHALRIRSPQMMNWIYIFLSFWLGADCKFKFSLLEQKHCLLLPS